MPRCIQVSTTTASREDAIRLARSTVEARLAASAQVIGPVASVFWHLSELGEGEEWQLLLRTTAERYAEVQSHLRREHTWDNPEVTATELTYASEDYLSWLSKTVGS